MGELFRFDRIADQEMARVPLSDDEIQRSAVIDGDLLFARRSLTLEGAGHCAIAASASEPRVFESSIIRVRLDKRIADPNFYFYFFRSPHGRALMDTIVEQVAVAGIRSSDLSRLSVPVPPIAEQRAIAEVLRLLDDRVDLKYKIVRDAQDYCRAELSRALFDGSEQVDVCSLVRSVQERAEVIEPTFPYVGLEHFRGFDLGLWRFGSADETSSASRLCRKGDLVFGRIRPYFGNVAVAGQDAVVAQSIEVLRPLCDEFREIAYLVLSSRQFIELATLLSSGTTMPQVKWVDLAQQVVEVPLQSQIPRLHTILSPFFDLLSQYPRETEQLLEVRSALTTELMAGRIRVRDVERVIEAAV